MIEVSAPSVLRAQAAARSPDGGGADHQPLHHVAKERACAGGGGA